MSIGTLVRIPQTYRNLQRLREILAVVVKYGFGDLVARLDLESQLERGRNLLRSRRHRRALVRYTTEERIRLALEELGPTFVKLGQVLATRPDLVPDALARELRKLQDAATPFAPAEARRRIEAEWGVALEERLERFDERPLAAASIAQVHRAALRGGEEVAIKVRRPGVETTLRADLEILRGLAALLEERVPEVRSAAPVAVLDELAGAIAREIDFTHEGFNLVRFARNFEGDRRIHVPRVHLDLSTESVLTLEYIDGIKASDVAALDAAGLDRRELAALGVEFCLRQVFEHGFFHADPHPGNLFVLPGNVIAPVDMGMMGTLEPETIDDLLELLVGLLLRDPERILRLLRRRELVDDRVDAPRLRRDLRELIDRYYAVPIGQVDVARLVARLFELLRRHRVRLPPELLLMGKALATVDGLARELDPALDPIRAIRPFVLKNYLRRLSDPRFAAREWVEAGRAWVELAATLPGDLQAIARDLRRGELALSLRAESLDRLVLEQSRSANRQSLSLMVAGLLVGSALLLSREAGPAVAGLPLTWWLGGLGLGLAGLGYLVVAYGFLRSGRF